MEIRIRNWICLSLGYFLAAPGVEAQDFPEVSRRLEILERLWDKSVNDQARRLTSKSVDALTFLMLTRQAGKAAQTIDAAISEFRKGTPGESIPPWFNSLEIKVSKSLVDPRVESIQGTIRYTYPASIPASHTSRIRIRWTVNGKEMPHVCVPVPLNSTRFELIPPREMATAQMWCEPVGTETNYSVADLPQKKILLIPEWNEMKKQLLAKKNAIRSLPDSIGKLTWLQWLEDLSALEITDKGVAAIDPLKNLAALNNIPFDKIRDGAWPEPKPGTDQVLVLPLATGNKTVRIRLPLRNSVDPEHIPAVVALHGAGDNEHRWIDGYNRRLSNHSEQRGWILICPRDGHEPDLLPLLAKWSSLRIKRIAILGHSQGGSQALAFGAKYPDELLGIVVLGASGRVGDGGTYRRIPVFVGIGTEDFAFRSCGTMVEQMRDQDQQKLRYEQYKNMGHIMIPIASMTDVLGFLDNVLVASNKKGVPNARPEQ